MKNEIIIIKLIKWLARIWGTIILSFILFFTIAHIFGEEEAGEKFLDSKEIISFILFPISSIIGLTLAFKWEGLGGVITVIGMFRLFLMRFDLITNPYFILGIFPPGMLYLVYWFLTKKIV